MATKKPDPEPSEEAVEEIAEDQPEPVQKKAPVDPATGKPYKSGEFPPGCNEPIP